MTQDEQDDLIFTVDDTIRELKALIEAAESGGDCKSEDIESWNSRLNLQKATINNLTSAIFGFNEPF